MNGPVQYKNGTGIVPIAVAKRRSQLHQLKAFGAKLRAFRGPDRSREQIALRLRNHYGIKFDESTLVQYEKGTVWAPDPGVLMGLADIYDEPVANLIQMLLLNRAEPKYEATDADQVYVEAARQVDIDRRGERLITANFEADTEAGRRAHERVFAETIDAVSSPVTASIRDRDLQGGPDALPAASSAVSRLEPIDREVVRSEVQDAISILTRVSEELAGKAPPVRAVPTGRRRSHRKAG